MIGKTCLIWIFCSDRNSAKILEECWPFPMGEPWGFCSQLKPQIFAGYFIYLMENPSLRDDVPSYKPSFIVDVHALSHIFPCPMDEKSLKVASCCLHLRER